MKKKDEVIKDFASLLAESAVDEYCRLCDEGRNKEAGDFISGFVRHAGPMVEMAKGGKIAKDIVEKGFGKKA